jgi:hypothetical protein
MGLFDAIRGLFGGDEGDRSSSNDGADGTSAGGERDRSRSTGGSDRSESTERPDRSESTGEGSDRVIEDRSAFGEPDHVPPGCLVGDSVADLREMADDYAGTWEEFGPTDYSVDSIRGVDEMFASQQERANWLAIELDDGRTGGFAPMAAQPACYFGEVLIRNYDAEWVLDADYGWALAFGGETIVNLFGTAHGALDADPPFVRMHDTFVENYGLDGAPLDPGGERLAERRQSGGVDPGDFDDEALAEAAESGEPTAEQMREFAEDFVESHADYDLDYSVESLSAVDDVFDEHFRTDEFAEATLGGTDDEASLVLTATVSEAGGYFGEVLRRHSDAEWRRREGDGLKLEFPLDEADVRIDPMATASSVVEDDGSFAASYVELTESVDAVEAELDGADG